MCWFTKLHPGGRQKISRGGRGVNFILLQETDSKEFKYRPKCTGTYKMEMLLPPAGILGSFYPDAPPVSL